MPYGITAASVSVIIFTTILFISGLFEFDRNKLRLLRGSITCALISRILMMLPVFKGVLPLSAIILEYLFLYLFTQYISSKNTRIPLVICSVSLIISLSFYLGFGIQHASGISRIVLGLTGALLMSALPMLVVRRRIEASAFYLLFVFHNLGAALLPAFTMTRLIGLVVLTSLTGVALALMIMMILFERRRAVTGAIKQIVYMLFIVMLPMAMSLVFTIAPINSRVEFAIAGGAVTLDGQRLTLAFHLGAFAMTAALLGVALSEVETERRLREEANRASSQLDKLSSLGRLAAGMAHEINNPLGLIVGNALLLAEDAEDDEVKQTAELIGEEAERCSKIVRGMLDFSRQTPTAFAPVNPEELLEKAMLLVGHTLKKKNVKVSVDLAECPDLSGDSNMLLQVFLNLFTNAADAVESGGHVNVVWEMAEESIKIYFKDDGPGIPPEFMERIFEPFFTTKGVGRGTGLGLSVCRGIIESHNGRMTAEAPENGGAEIILELPIWDEKVQED